MDEGAADAYKSHFINSGAAPLAEISVQAQDWVGADATTTTTLKITAKNTWTLYSVKAVPAATMTEASTGTALSAGVDMANFVASVAGTISEQSQQFASTAASQQARYQQVQKRFSQAGSQDADALLTALSEEQIQVVKFKGNSRGWVMPYASHFTHQGNGTYLSGSKEKYYGVMVGGTHYLKGIGTNLTAIVGVGASKQQMDRSCHSHTEGKNVMLGLSLRKAFFST